MQTGHHHARRYAVMAVAAIEPFLASSARECKKSLVLFNFRRLQACFGWAKNGTSQGYGAWFRYSRAGGKTVTISMLLGILPFSTNSFSSKLGVDSVPELSINRKKITSPAPPRSNLSIIFRQPWLIIFLFFRCIKLSILFLPLILLYPLTHLQYNLKRIWLQLLLRAFEFSGPTFMKFGQWMSTRRDIFSPELCTIFSTLHRNVPPHSFRHTANELTAAFGKSWKNQIVFSSKNPVGSGCVGQVYKVRVLVDAIAKQDPDQNDTADSLGPFDITPVRSPTSGVSHIPDRPKYVDAALKVLHPKMFDYVTRDLIILEIGASFLELIFKDLRWLRLRDSVMEFGGLMQKQLDLRVEAQNLDHFRRNFINFRSVHFPVPHYPFVTKNVLLESWEDGTSLGSFISDDIPRDLKKELASIGADVLLKMTFVDNFVHADMHPGNLFVRNCSTDPVSVTPAKIVFEDIGDVVIVGIQKRPSPLQLIIIDAGLTASLSQYDFESFKGVFAAVVKGDGNMVADKFLLHATADACSDRPGFRKDISALVKAARSQELSLSQVEAGQLLSDLFSVLVKYQVKLESNFISIMLAIMVLEGLGRSLDPNLDLLEKAKPVLLRKLIF